MCKYLTITHEWEMNLKNIKFNLNIQLKFTAPPCNIIYNAKRPLKLVNNNKIIIIY